MTASELQEQQQQQQQPRARSRPPAQLRAAEISPNVSSARDSLEMEPLRAPTTPDIHVQSVSAAAQETETWTTKETIPSNEQGPNASEPTRRPSHLSEILGHWMLELVTILVAVLLIIAIIVLLACYDRKTLPKWPLEISLSTVIALLTTFLRAAMLAAVAEIVGQIKWTWFTERTRPLRHLQDFDSASRSVLGSLRLLAVVMWNFGWTSAGLLGIAASLVTILSLAVGPFTQQALKTAMCPTLLPNARAEIPVAQYAPGRSSFYRIGAGTFEIEVDMKSAMIAGLTFPDGKDNEVEVTCGTSNCTWEDYGIGATHATVGLCSACLDTTDYVSGPDEGGNLTLPDQGSSINYNTGGQYMWVGYSNLTWASALFNEDFARAASVAISNFSILASTTSPCTRRPDSGFFDCPHSISQNPNMAGLGDYIAASCALYPCMKEYRGQYSGNRYTETIVRTTPALPNKQETSSYSYEYNYTAVRSPCILNDGDYFTDTSNTTLASHILGAGTWYTQTNMSAAPQTPGRTWANITLTNPADHSVANTSVPNACLYKMNSIYATALSRHMSDSVFTGHCSYDNAQAGHINCRDSWWLVPLWGSMNATFASLDAAIDSFATTVTNKLRMTGSGPDLLMGQPLTTRSAALGLVYESSTCTYFDWRWLSLPVVLVLVCAGLLAWIIVKNYTDPEQPVWKGSLLPLMFFGLHGPAATTAPPTAPPSSSASHHAPAADASAVRLDRSATFMSSKGRSVPELGKIRDEAGRMLVRFHGGKDPGFVDLGSPRTNQDAEANVSSASLLAGARQSRRNT